MTKDETIAKLASLLVRCFPYVIIFYDPTKFSASMSEKNAHQLAHEVKRTVHLLEGELVEAHNEIVERLERNRDAALERAQAALVHAELDSVQRGYVHDIIAALKGEPENVRCPLCGCVGEKTEFAASKNMEYQCGCGTIWKVRRLK